MTKSIEAEFPLVTTEPRRSGKVGARRARVLIAEDDWAFRDMLTFAFEDTGYDVVAVGDGASLTELLASSLSPKSAVKPFDLVVSDVKMPGWSGLAALEKVCCRRATPPVLVITAFGSQEVHDRAKRAGAVAVLNKPFRFTDLMLLSHRALTQHLE
jgi:CheY-like chemotaxis protein